MTKILLHSVAAAALIMAAPAAFAQSTQPSRDMAQTSTSDQQTTPRKHEHHSASDERGGSGSGPSMKSSEQSNATEGQSGSAQQKSTTAGKSDESQTGKSAESSESPSKKSTAEKSQKGSEKSSEASGSKGDEHGTAASAEKSGTNAQTGERSHANAATSGTANSTNGPANSHAATSGSADQHQSATMGEGGHKIAPGKEKRIREAVRGEHVQNISHADFSVSVGTVIPSHYHFYPLPEDIVSIVPDYRGYDYVVVNDEIAIVEPQSHRIVYTLPENESASAEGHHRSNCD